MIDYKKLAAELSPNVKPSVLEAVAKIESSGNGFLSDGSPKILFEPHVFWRCLVKKGLKPSNYTKGNEDILYAKWKRGAYGKISEQHTRLQRAALIDRDCALMACSWGAFQILAENWKSLGYKRLQDFINDAYTEEGQVRLFARFVKNNYLTDELEREDYKGFAIAYNGQDAIKNDYPNKMKTAAAALKDKAY